MKTAIITGITGQDAAYLAKFLLSKNYRVVGLTRSPIKSYLANLQYLGINKHVEIFECDLLDISRVINLIKEIKPDEIYNLAAQSSVGFSFDQPIATIQFNIISVINILEGLRLFSPRTHFYQASSSEMYGKVDNLPVKIDTSMHPLSPYAISKASAHWIVVNYRESYGLFACNGVLFNHESYLRPHTFFIKKVIQESMRNVNVPDWTLKLGNIEVRRDFGHSENYVEAMWLMLNHSKPKDFLICSGKSYLLKDLVHFIFSELGISKDKLEISHDLYRLTEIQDMYGDPTNAKLELGWKYNLNFFDVLKGLLVEERIALEKLNK